MYKTLIQTF